MSSVAFQFRFPIALTDFPHHIDLCSPLYRPFPLQFQLQVIRPFASEYTDFLNADQFKTEWYMSLRYKVSDLQASVFRKFQGPGRMNMTAAMNMMDTTAQMMQNMTAAAATGYQMMSEDMSSMSSAEQQGGMAEMAAAPMEMAGMEAAGMETAGMPQYGQYSGDTERYWSEYGHHHQTGNAVPWNGYVNRQGEIDNSVEVEPDTELFEAQKFRIDQKMKIYERMEQMYKRWAAGATRKTYIYALTCH